MTQFSKKCFRESELSHEWASLIANPNARPEKNSAFYKTYKPDVTVILLITESNTTVENLVIIDEKIVQK